LGTKLRVRPLIQNGGIILPPFARIFMKKMIYFAGILIFVSHAFSTFAATATVSVVNFSFSPNSTVIAPGDSVVWNWSSADGGTPHTSTSDTNGLWDSGAKTEPASFTNTFPTAGIFPYHCTFHAVTFNMRGTITVQAPNVPPSISITNPPAGTTLSAPANLQLAANAMDAGGTITNVQFFQGATSLGNVTTPPFFISANNLAAGDYTFSAIASGNSGLTATNSITVHIVTAEPILMSAPQFSPPGNFIFNYTANTNLSYVIQSSSNLFDWNNLQTNIASAISISFTNSNATNNPAFYRVELLPNP